MILTNYNNSGGDARFILVKNVDTAAVYDTNNTDVSATLKSLGILRKRDTSILVEIFGANYVDVGLLACDCPLYNDADKFNF